MAIRQTTRYVGGPFGDSFARTAAAERAGVPLRPDRIDDLKSLARKAARSAEDHAARLGRSDPEIPEAIFNRDADNWRPLFTVAEIAGGNWPERVKKAALAQTGAVDSDETQILADVGDLFAEKSLTKDDDGMPCHTLVDALVAMPDRSWSECNRGKALTNCSPP